MRPLFALLLLSACSPGNPVIDTGDGPLVFDCEGNNDGQLQADELQVPLGTSVPYLANNADHPVGVSLDGANVGGETHWDFSDGPDAVSVDFDLIDPATAWFADDFPTATWATPLFAHSPDLLGVFERREGGVDMLGVVSREESPTVGTTLLVYDTPVMVYRFPLYQAAQWTVDTTFRNALVFGNVNQGDEHYAFVVDQSGSLTLDGFTFEKVLRIKVESTQSFAVSTGTPASTIQYLWVTECFGELVRAVSQPGETDPSFTVASELRRLDVSN